MIHEISDNHLNLKTVQSILMEDKKLKLSLDSIQKIEKSRTYLNEKIKSSEVPIYGINTGFG